MFYNGDDDEHDFLPTSGRSKLASLFGMDNTGEPSSNESLTYKAPTEPKKKHIEDTSGVPSQKTAAAASTSVLTAAAVFAYKYVDNQYASQGKLGAAVIGNHSTNDYKILLYYTKEKPVAFAQITSSFTFVIQPNNYATFYDDSRQSWSLMFESEASLLQFLKQVTLSKANGVAGGAQKLDSLVFQDLVTGDGPSLELGDSVELKFTGWLFDNGTVGTMFDSSSSSDQLLRFKVGKIKSSKVWEDSVVGMRKGGRRMLIIPPSIPYDCDGKIGKAPSDSVTIFEIDVLRVKFVRDRSNEVTQTESSVPNVMATDHRDSPEDEETKPRSRSITGDQPPQVAKPDKAKLISRMAKMGQSMLPKLSQPDAVEPDVPTSSPHVTSASPTMPRPEIPGKPVHQPVAPSVIEPAPVHQQPYLPQSQHYASHPFQPSTAVHNMFQGPVPSSQLAVYQPQHYAPLMAGYPQMMAQQYGASVLGPNPVYPPTSMPQPVAALNSTDPNMPMMMMETRQQNTEVRVSLSKISDKVDRISDRMDQLALQHNTSMSLSNSLPTMEVNMLVHSIEKIVSENERIRKELLDKSCHIDGLNVKILQLIQQNQVYAEQSNTLLEQRNVTYTSTANQNQAQVLQLQQDKIDLATRLSSISSQLADSQLEITAFKKREGELKLQLERLLTSDSQSRDDLGSHKVQLAETVHQLEQMTSQMRDEQQQRKQLQMQNINLQENVLELRNQCETLEKNIQEKKKKSGEEILKMELEMKEMQANFELELSSLKERLKHEKNSTEMTTVQQITQMEEDLNRQWKEKSERIQSSLLDKHQREVQELNSERHLLEEKVGLLEKKVQELKAFRDASEQKIDIMKDELDEMKTWKDKYDGLRTQAVLMKQRYEDRIAELVKETEMAEQSRDSLEERLSRAVEAGRRLQSQLSMVSATVPASKDDASSVQDEVKKVMNSVYRRLRSEFEADSTYDGSDIHAVILDVIKTVTLEVVQPRTVERSVINVQPRTTEDMNVSTSVAQSSTEKPQKSDTSNEQTTDENSSTISTNKDALQKFVSHEQEEAVPTVEKSSQNQEKEIVPAVEKSTENQEEETVPAVDKSTQNGAEEIVPAVYPSTQNQEEEAVLMADPADSVLLPEDDFEKSTVNYQEIPTIDDVSKLRRLSTNLPETDNSSNELVQSQDVVDFTPESVIQLAPCSNKPALDGAVDVESESNDDLTNCDRNELNNVTPSEIIVSSNDIDGADVGKGPCHMENPTDNMNTRSSVTDEKIERTVEDGSFVADSLMAASEVAGDTDDKLFAENIKITRNDNNSDTVLNDAVVVNESDAEHSSIPPNITAQSTKSKLKTSIFNDDDDDDDLFGNVTSKFVPLPKTSSVKKASSAKESVKPHRVTESDEDLNRKPPPLFGNSDSDEDDWMT